MPTNRNQTCLYSSRYSNLPRNKQLVNRNIHCDNRHRQRSIDKACSQVLFLNTLPVAVEAGAAVFVAAVFFVAPAPVTPLLMVPITDLFVVKGGSSSLSTAPAAPLVVPFFTTVDVLSSLDSEKPLALRAVLAVAAPLVVSVPAAIAAFLPLTDPPAEPAVVEKEAVCFRAIAPGRVDRAFSARLLKRLDAPCCFTGDGVPVTVLAPARAISNLPPGVVRGRVRTLAEVGDRTLDDLLASASGAG